jgi:molecular chaperone GrpE
MKNSPHSIDDEALAVDSEFARELLTVVDNLQRTIEAANKQSQTGAANDALLEGVRATLRAFLQTLERFGIRPIDALGKPFDPNLHEAVMEVDDPLKAPGIVTQVLEQGYTIRDRLLRPARVIVSKKSGKKPAEPPPGPKDDDLGSLWDGHSIDPR